MTATVSQVLGEHHAWCDTAIRSIASAVTRSDWPEAGSHDGRMQRGLEWHMEAEEARLFPAFEAATGMVDGPTSVMRYEHRQIRELLAACSAAIQARDSGAAHEAIARLEALLMQHNAKEERILYPMCDRALGADAEVLAAQLQSELAHLS